MVDKFSTIAEREVFQHAHYACSQATTLSKKAVRKMGSVLYGKERPSWQERTLGTAQATKVYSSPQR